MIKLIVTGSIGSGKSTVMSQLAERLKDEDITFVDMDQIVSDLYDNPDFVAELKSRFGVETKADVVKLVFEEDVSKRAEFNNFANEWVSQYLTFFALNNENVILEYPLFFEAMLHAENNVSRLIRKFFTVVAVTVGDEELRIKRIKERCKVKHPHWTESQINAIIDAQIADPIKCGLSDVSMINDGDEHDLKEVVDEFVDEWLDECKGEFVPVLEEMAGLGRHCRIHRDVFRLVQDKYGEPHRHYHNMDHIAGMFNDLAMSNANELLNYEPMQLAILFHDIVYNPLSHSNEENSVRLMHELLQMFNPEIEETRPEVLGLAETMIVATVTHHIPDDVVAQAIYDQHPQFLNALETFLDLDVLIFTSVFDDVDEYDNNIRMEYIDVDDATFNDARLEVLISFYNREHIFVSETFGSARNNDRAKKNLKKLIEKYEKLVNG